MNKWFKRTKKKLTGDMAVVLELAKSKKFTHFMLKFDGTHAELIIDTNKTSFITRDGNDVSHLVPHLIQQIDKWQYREAYLGVYACELVHVDAVLNRPRQSWNLSRNVLGRKEYDASQPEIQCVIYDVHERYYQDLDDNYLNRRKALPHCENLSSPLGYQCISLPDFIVPNLFGIGKLPEYWERFIINNKNEGVVLCNLNKAVKWENTFTKVKPLMDLDCIVIGFYEGSKGTKNEGKVGSIEVGLVHPEKGLVSVGKVPHMNEEERDYWTKIWKGDSKCESRVIQVECSEITSGNKLRFPNYVRLRNDKEEKDCTWEQLEK